MTIPAGPIGPVVPASSQAMTTIGREPSERLLRAVRWGFVPLMFLGVNGAGLYIIFTAASSVVGALALVSLMALALVLSFTAERVLPYEAAWNESFGDTGRDVVHFVVNESLRLGPTLVIPLFVVAVPEPPGALWPLGWPLAFQILFAFVVFDLGQNLFHWASHVWTPLWRLHAVHHEVQRMYALNGILKHPLYQVVASVVSLLPLVALGMPDVFGLAIAFCSFVQLLLQHSNVDYATGWLRKLIATAEVHRFHHLRGASGNVNFALFFSFWDELLGNAYDSKKHLSTDDIGLEDRDYPKSWGGQFVAPFKGLPR